MLIQTSFKMKLLTKIFSSSGCNLFWVPLSPDTRSKSKVQVLLGQDQSRRWYELNQTISTSFQLSLDTLQKMDKIRVLSVSSTLEVESAELMVPEIQSCQSLSEKPGSWNPELRSIQPVPGWFRAEVGWTDIQSPTSYPAKYIVRKLNQTFKHFEN